MARAIADALGVPSKGRGYLQGQVDGKPVLVSWCIGHLVELADAAEYGKKSWSFSNLPILPRPFAYAPIASTIDQFETVRGLLLRPDVDEVVNATDAGREGQLIFHLVYDLVGCAKPVKRLWTSALTTDAIVHAWNTLKDDREYAGLTAAAHCRQQADWLIGINCTRAQTLVAQALGGTGVHSIGRVQTPTLAILVRRELEIAQFVPKEFWTLLVRFRTEDGATYLGKWFRPGQDGDAAEERFDTEAAAQQLRQALLDGRAQVTKVDKKQERRKPELLYDLTTLQREANKRLGFTAEHTLQIAQELYEAQLISYPRTNSRHLTTGDAAQAPTWLSALDRGPFAPLVAAIGAMGSNGNFPPIGKRFVDDKQVEDHPAITVTNKAVRIVDGQLQLTPDQKLLYELIARRLLSTWFGDRVEQKTVAITAITPKVGAVEQFRTTGVVLVEAGWSAVDQPRRDKKDGKPADEDGAELPPLRRGESVEIVDSSVKAGKTSPPKSLTEADLLAAMQGAGKLLDDDELRGAMKDCGLGTPATRASIIEALLKRGFVERKAKNLVATPKGIDLIQSIPVEALKSPELTGQWEAAMEQIRRGAAQSSVFMSQIEQFTLDAVQRLRQAGLGSQTLQAAAQRTTGPIAGQGASESGTGLPVCALCGSPNIIKVFGDRRSAACSGLRRPDCRGGYDLDALNVPVHRCVHCNGPRRGSRDGPTACLRCGRTPTLPVDRPNWPPLHACPQCKGLVRVVWIAAKSQWSMVCGICDKWLNIDGVDAIGPEPQRPGCPTCALPMAAVWSRQRQAWLLRCVDCGPWQWADAQPKGQLAAGVNRE